MQHPRHVRHETPPGSNVHGLGLTAAQTPPNAGTGSQSRNYDMPSLPHLRVQQLSPVGVIRRKELPEDASLMPARSSSLKNRKSRKPRPASFNSTIQSLGDYEEQSHADDLDFVPRNLDLFPHLGHTPQLPFTFDKSIDNRIPKYSNTLMPNDIPPPLRGGSNKELPARPKLDRGFTSFHTAQGSLSDDEDEYDSPTDRDISHNTLLPPLRTPGVSGIYDGQASARAHTHGYSFELPILPSGAKWQNGNNTNDTTAYRFPQDDFDLPGADLKLPQDVYALQSLVEELREELRGVSVELATSIQREMDLEDEMDKLNAAIPASSGEVNRRTSDYFSESSGSSARMSAAQSESRMEGLEKMRRKAEQEKADLRRSLAHRLEQDIAQRKEFELHRQSLETQLHNQQEHQDTVQALTEKAKELEDALEDAQRRLIDERQIRENIENLFNSLQQDSRNTKSRSGQGASVAELSTRIETLELEAVRAQQVSEENVRLRQEVDSVKAELGNGPRSSTKQTTRMLNDVVREDLPMSPRSPQIGVQRTTSIVRRSARQGSISSEAAIPEASIETLKHIEEQRDALQGTLQSLVYRFSQQEHQHAKRTRALQKELDRATNRNPKRTSLNSEVQHLRAEFEQLRRHAEEVVEQKWQCEKGLGGLRIDMDRKQQDVNELREKLMALKNLGADDTGATSITSTPDLCKRMQDVLDQGTTFQLTSAQRLGELQDNLKLGEERVLAAQNISEEIVEEQERLLKDLGNSRREIANRGITRSSTLKTQHTPVLPSSPNPQARTPKLPTSSSFASNIKPLKMMKLRVGQPDPAKIQALRTYVQSLEDETVKADQEIRDIMERMARAQAEAAGLQIECDEVFKRARKARQGQYGANSRPVTPAPFTA